MKRTVLALLCSAGLALPVAAQQSVDETRAVAADAAITVSTISGSVRVSGSDRADVRITGTLGRGIEKLEVTGSGSRLEIRVVYPHDCHDCGDANLEISVPAGSRPEVQTVSADIDVSGVKGEVRIESVSGDVTLATSGDVRAKTVSSTLKVRGGGPRIEATSVSGDVQVTAGPLDDAELETVSGDIRVESELAPRARLEAHTVSGEVELRLPASTGATFEAESFSGSIRTELGSEAQTTSEHGPGHKLHFATGDGAARVYLKSFSGDVRILKK
jgi:hypothetical protein